MRLKNVARYFDDTPLADAYTGQALGYKGQFSTFMEADPDGSVSTSRSMSLKPEAVLPSRRVVTLLGETWLLGEPSRDGFKGEAIRQTVPMRRVTDLFSITTPGQLMTGLTGVSAYGRRDYLKDTVDGTTSAGYFPFYQLFFASSETAPLPGAFFRSDTGALYRCRSLYAAKDGMTCAQCDLIDRSGTTFAEFGSPTYDPITDSYGEPGAQRQALAILPHQNFIKASPADPPYLPGDLTLLVRQLDGAVEVGQPFKLHTEALEWLQPEWWSGLVPARVLSVTPEADVWNLHIRRA